MHMKCQHLASEEGEKPQEEGRPCDARAELGSDVEMWESFGFPAEKLSNEYWYVHTHQEGRKMLAMGAARQQGPKMASLPPLRGPTR